MQADAITPLEIRGFFISGVVSAGLIGHAAGVNGCQRRSAPRLVAGPPRTAGRHPGPRPGRGWPLPFIKIVGDAILLIQWPLGRPKRQNRLKRIPGGLGKSILPVAGSTG